MATKFGDLNLNIYDSERKPLSGAKVLVTLTDGYGRQLHRKHHDGNVINFRISLADNLTDRYTVNVAADGRRDAGFTPVVVTSDHPQEVHVMLTPQSPVFRFPDKLSDVEVLQPNVHQHLIASNMTDAQYQNLKTAQESAKLATLFNTLTALDHMSIRPGETVLTLFYKSVLLGCLKPDRFYAKVDSRLKSFLKENNDVFSTAGAGLHSAEDCAAEVKSVKPLGSFKQTLFLESNVQFTFYEGLTKDVDVVENDMDYFADTAAHLLLEVFPNSISKKLGHPILTDPRHAYVFRWSQSKNLLCWKPDRTPEREFNPPMVLVKAAT